MNPIQTFAASLQGKTANPLAPGASSASGSPYSSFANASVFNKPAATPSSPSAVNPAASRSSPAPSSTPASGARSAYTASLAPSNTGLTSADVMANIAKYNAANPASAVTTPSTPASGTSNGTPAGTTGADSSTDSSVPSYVAAYQKALAAYTASLAPSTATTTAATTLAGAQNSVDAATLASNQQYQTDLDTPGMLKAGAQAAATQDQRRNNANIANLSVTEGADARTLSALQGTDTAAQTAASNALSASKPLQIGDSYYDTTTGQLIPNTSAAANTGYTLSPGDSRYDANGNLIATAPTTSSMAGTIPVTDTNGNTTNVPLSVAPYYNTTDSGVSYMDASDIQGTAADKAQAIQDAQNAGITVVTNKNEVADLTNIDDADSNLDTISSIMAGIDQPDALSRDLYGIGLTKLASAAQSNPQQAAAGALQSVGLDILKAVSGIQGFRGNASVIQQVTDHLPTIYDTQATINSKIAFIKDLITNRQNAILGIKAPAATNTGQPVSVTAPDGSVHSFPDQASADAFSKAAGIVPAANS